MIYERYENVELAEFIDAMRDCFFNNLTNKDYTCINDVIIKKGTKIIRAFKYFVTDKNIRTELQNKASMIIQEDKIIGTLCASVHPLDFLSSSENDHNWRSCHALDGEYRAGNLSYMTDTGTIIIYLKSDQSTILPNFPESVPWNSKKWRVLLFFSKDHNMLFLGRQYPFTAEGGAEFISQKLLPMMGLGTYTSWTDLSLTGHIIGGDIHHNLIPEYYPVGGHLIEKKELIKDGHHALMFNDLLRSSYYTPMYCFKHLDYGNVGHYKRTRFKIGNHVPCLCCGKSDIISNDKMLCPDCEDQYNKEHSICCICGKTYLTEEGIWIEEFDDYICPDCYETEFEFCTKCGKPVWKANMSSSTDAYMCLSCQTDIMRQIRKRSNLTL